MTLQLQMVLTALLTSFITGMLTFLASWGLLPGLDIKTVSSGLASALAVALVAAGSGWVSAYLTKSKSIINAAAEQPTVSKIVTDAATATAAPSTKVVSE